MAKQQKYNPFWVDPYDLCKRNGIEVKEVEKLEDDVVSKSFLDGKKKIIELRSDLHPTRKRFYVAHGLGHFKNGDFGHRKEFVERKIDLENPDLFESWANDFALETLMPKSKIDFMIGEGVTDTALIAANLGVSVEMAIKRLRGMGYIS